MAAAAHAAPIDIKKLIDVEAEIRGTLRGFGLKIGKVGRAGFEARVRELLADQPSLLRVVAPVLIVRATLLAQREALHTMLLQAVRHDEVCRRLMTVPGVGPVTSLAFRATVVSVRPDRYGCQDQGSSSSTLVILWSGKRAKVSAS